MPLGFGAPAGDVTAATAAVPCRLEACDPIIAELTKAIGRQPQNVKLYYERAKAYEGGLDEVGCNTGGFSKAIGDYDKAIELSPRFAKAYKARGVARGHLCGDDPINPLIQDFTRAIELSPKDGEAYYLRAKAFTLYENASSESPEPKPQDYLESALRDCQKAVALDPKKAEYYRCLGEIHEKLQEPGKALDQLAAALKLDPRNSDLRLLRAESLLKLKRTEEALADCDASIAIWPENLNALLLRADIYKSMGRAEEEKADRQRAYQALRNTGSDLNKTFIQGVLDKK